MIIQFREASPSFSNRLKKGFGSMTRLSISWFFSNSGTQRALTLLMFISSFSIRCTVPYPMFNSLQSSCIVTGRSTSRRSFTNLTSLVLDFDTGRPHLSSSIIVSRPSLYHLCHLYTKDCATDGFFFDLFNISIVWTGVCPRPTQISMIACCFSFSSDDIFM